jgi:hypothetical protein
MAATSESDIMHLDWRSTDRGYLGRSCLYPEEHALGLFVFERSGKRLGI